MYAQKEGSSINSTEYSDSSEGRLSRLIPPKKGISKQLDYPYLEIYDKKEQRKTMDLKFNSIYKFLLTKFPDKEDLYAQINQDYHVPQYSCSHQK